MGVGAILGIVLGCLALLAIAFLIWWFVASYHAIINKLNKAKEAFAELDSLLKDRYADVSAFVEACGDVCDDELKSQLLSARNVAMASTDCQERLENEAKLEMEIEKATLVYQAKKAEISPKNQEICDILCKNQAFINKSRQFYNSMVWAYNDKLLTITGRFWAKNKQLEPMEMFELQ